MNPLEQLTVFSELSTSYFQRNIECPIWEHWCNKGLPEIQTGHAVIYSFQSGTAAWQVLSNNNIT